MKYILTLMVATGAVLASAIPMHRGWKLAIQSGNTFVDLSYHRSQDECEAKKNLFYKGQDSFKCIQIR